MKVLITGGGGFLGHRLAQAIAARGALAGPDGREHAVTAIRLLDTAFPPGAESRFDCVAGDLSAPGVIERVLERDTGAVFHLAAVVSGGAEADFDLGMRVNLDGTRALLEACRRLAGPPRFVFASSVAAFGGDLPPVLDDTTTPNPQTSYGMQKVVGEYLVTEFSRRGFIDGRSLRLPTIVVRPGKPNLAASSFASGIIREPLNGEPSALPVPDTTGIWLLSPGRVIEAFIHAHELASAAWGVNRVVNLPGISVTVREMLAALARIAGPAVAARVTYQPDERIQRIVKTWPAAFRTDRALALGFRADAGIEDVIREYIRDQGLAVQG
ncbi:MAG: SDR family oxidoreductase [Burkholderiales bacterium]|nr:SDR family oxidoreductase [Burkholderiales bacterium]